MLFSEQNLDDAVSTVVAVILTVAVTVILAAVIESFVLDLGNNVQANPQAGVTFDQTTSADEYDSNADGTNDATGYEVTVQIVSMENADDVTIKYANNDAVEDVWNDGTTSGVDYVPASTTETVSTVGATASFDHLTPDDKLTVIGALNGKEAVLQSYTVK